jgi:hypothetical protein
MKAAHSDPGGGPCRKSGGYGFPVQFTGLDSSQLKIMKIPENRL